MTKSCPLCGHSRAAHTDGRACVLCKCRSEKVEPQQESLPFGRPVVVSPATRRR